MEREWRADGEGMERGWSKPCAIIPKSSSSHQVLKDQSGHHQFVIPVQRYGGFLYWQNKKRTVFRQSIFSPFLIQFQSSRAWKREPEQADSLLFYCINCNYVLVKSERSSLSTLRCTVLPREAIPTGLSTYPHTGRIACNVSPRQWFVCRSCLWQPPRTSWLLLHLV